MNPSRMHLNAILPVGWSARFVLTLLSAGFLLCGHIFVSTVAAQGVLTQRNDNQRTGAYLEEKLLTPENVNSARFGLLYTLAVEGTLGAQPLFVPGVFFNGSASPRDILYVATRANKLYAFDVGTPRLTHPAAAESCRPC